MKTKTYISNMIQSISQTDGCMGQKMGTKHMVSHV